jgi:hypothetical protein
MKTARKQSWRLTGRRSNAMDSRLSRMAVAKAIMGHMYRASGT